MGDAEDAEVKLAAAKLAIEALIADRADYAEVQLAIEAFKNSVADRPGLVQLHGYLFSRYQLIAPWIDQIHEKEREFENWFRELFKRDSNVGSLGVLLFWGKSKKEFLRYPITATTSQRIGIHSDWVKYVLLQAYQLKTHTHFNVTTGEDAELISTICQLALAEAYGVTILGWGIPADE